MLDEPTNDLDFAGCAIVISHDRWFLDRIATHILAFAGNSHVECSKATSDTKKTTRKSASALKRWSCTVCSTSH
jgi:ATPase subunit of ABC transporter with duplicated ATPase domains